MRIKCIEIRGNIMKLRKRKTELKEKLQQYDSSYQQIAELNTGSLVCCRKKLFF